MCSQTALHQLLGIRGAAVGRHDDGRLKVGSYSQSFIVTSLNQHEGRGCLADDGVHGKRLRAVTRGAAAR